MKFIHLHESGDQHLTFDRKGEYVVFFHNISGVLRFTLAAAGVELNIFGLFVGKKKDNFQIETIQQHTVPDSVSNLLIKGVFFDESKCRYQGLIRLEKEAQRSHAYQKNQNLIISPNAFVDSRPFLEILANDVFCTHGSTTGRLNKESIEYLQTRGLPKSDAEQLLIYGFIQEVYDQVKAKVPSFEFS